MRIENDWRVETLTIIEEFERLRELNSSLSLDREYIFCRETQVRRYLFAHYSTEDFRFLFNTYNTYIDKYLSLITSLTIKDCKALGLYRKPISSSLLKALVEKSITIVQIEKGKKRGPKKRKISM
jgi:hypothetical protein